MKIKYLPAEDRRNIRRLKKTTDYNEIAEILDSVYSRPFTLQVLWEYRYWYNMLDDEYFERYPRLKYGLIQIKICEGNIDTAKVIMDTIGDNVPYKDYMMPILPNDALDNYYNHLLINPHERSDRPQELPLTTGRPSIISGMWDFSEQVEDILNDGPLVNEMLSLVFDEKANEIKEMLQVEALYQRNEVYQALVKAIGIIPLLKDREEMRLLFVALAIQTNILLLNNQATSSVPLIQSLKEQIIGAGLEEFIPNIAAFEARVSMYDGDYNKVMKWFKDDAPDEYMRFNMLDIYRYLVKIRVYIIQGKYMAVTTLTSRVIGLLKKANRYMDICEFEILWALSEHARGDEKSAFKHLENAIEIGEKYYYYRLFADEGLRMFELLKAYLKMNDATDFILSIKDMAQKVAISHPYYMVSQLKEKPQLTEKEIQVLKLLEAGYSNSQIAEVTETTVDNAKFHCKNIYKKLDVSSRYQAVKKALDLGLLK